MREGAVPEDFPHDPFQASLGGAQAKFAARHIGDRFVVGLTDEERLARYRMCRNLVEQLLAYCQRKAADHPEWSREALLARVEKAVITKQAEWELGGAEVQWIVGRLRAVHGNGPQG